MKFFRCAMVLFVLYLSAFLPAAEIDDYSAKILKSLGIKSSPETMIAFFEKGPSRPLDGKVLVEHGIPATQIMIIIMQEFARIQYKPAVPSLIKTAQGEFTWGQLSLVDFDCQRSPRSSQENQRRFYYEFLKFNAVNALGLIGDPSALPVLEGIYNTSPQGYGRTNAALAMASLGYGAGIVDIVKETGSKIRRRAADACLALSYITGIPFDYEMHTPVIRRKRTAEKAAQWWKNNKGTFRPNGEEIRERRLNPPPIQPPSLISLREMLLAASNLNDPDNQFRSMDAREQLANLGTGVIRQMRLYCLDPEEDLNIRMEALRRYSQMAPRDDVETVLKKTRKDDNPEIRDLSKNLIEQLKRKSK